MAIEIGRKYAIGIAREATAGTAVDPAVWIPASSIAFNPQADYIPDGNSFGSIHGSRGAQIARKWGEAPVTGIARANSIAYLIYAGLGSIGNATLVETGVYSHTASVPNTNTHQSFTLTLDNATAEEQMAYCLLSRLELSASVEDYLQFSADFTGKAPSTDTGNSPSFSL